jgi:hypothetical protein
MLPSCYESEGHPQRSPLLKRNSLLQRHPVLMPFLLLSGAVALGSVSLFASNLFPAVMLIGVPSDLLYFSIAFVLGVCGILVSIIGILERIDRCGLPALLLPGLKEHGYANRN